MTTSLPSTLATKLLLLIRFLLLLLSRLPLVTSRHTCKHPVTFVCSSPATDIHLVHPRIRLFLSVTRRLMAPPTSAFPWPNSSHVTQMPSPSTYTVSMNSARRFLVALCFTYRHLVLGAVNRLTRTHTKALITIMPTTTLWPTSVNMAAFPRALVFGQKSKPCSASP